jgi:hypothetical protein
MQTALVTNLARRLDSHEIEVLLSVDDLYVSCDTTDAALFKQTRSGNVSILIHNLVDLQALAIRRTGSTKPVSWHCVLNSVSYRTLEGWVGSGLVLGVAKFIVAQILPKAHNKEVTCITKLPESEFREALGIIARARELATRGGRVFALQAGFEQELEQRSGGAMLKNRAAS